jgi:hypothetical protein
LENTHHTLAFQRAYFAMTRENPVAVHAVMSTEAFCVVTRELCRVDENEELHTAPFAVNMKLVFRSKQKAYRSVGAAHIPFALADGGVWMHAFVTTTRRPTLHSYTSVSAKPALKKIYFFH